MSKIKIGLFVAVVLVTLGVYSISKIKQASDATIFSYPLVLMDLTRQTQLNQQSTITAKSLYRTNHFTHIQIFPDHSFRNVVRPNNDTLYSIAWLDLSDEPIVLSVPEMDDRYYVMPLMDAWTNTNPIIGKRMSGTQAGDYLISGPNWQGAVPASLKQVTANTNMTWIIGRIQTNGSSDIPTVAALQNQFKLTPLSHWDNKNSNPNLIIASKTLNESLAPMEQIESMSADTFFRLGSKLVKQQPPTANDQNTLNIFNQLGFSLEDKRPHFLDRYLIDFAFNLTKSKFRQSLNERPANENGWKVMRDVIGDYGTDYKVRTAVAMVGLGAVTPNEASYPTTSIDSTGQSLTGKHRYRIRFAAGQTPPVRAFWSLSMYSKQGFFIENPINRYSIGDRNALNFNTDGSLDLIVQHQQPDDTQANWLPAPEDEFELTLRIYHAKDAFLNGSWQLPAVERLTE